MIVRGTSYLSTSTSTQILCYWIGTQKCKGIKYQDTGCCDLSHKYAWEALICSNTISIVFSVCVCQANVCSQILNQIHHWGEDAGHAEDSREEVSTTILLRLWVCENWYIQEGLKSSSLVINPSHTSTAMKHSEAAVLTVADLADLFTEDTEHLEWIPAHLQTKRPSALYGLFAHLIFFLNMKFLKLSYVFPKSCFSDSLTTNYISFYLMLLYL